MPEPVRQLELHVELSGVDDVGAGPFEHRMIADASGGVLVGDRLLLGADGYGRLDVRLTCRTGDGATPPHRDRRRALHPGQPVLVGEDRLLPGPRVGYRPVRVVHS